MSKEQQSTRPFGPLGRQLKSLRERVHETLAEVSGAVEIDIKDLANYELGQARPTEDILLLLISHFGAKDDEAVKLWELAGYNMAKIPGTQMINDDNGNVQQNVMVMPSEVRIVYTDMVHVMVNNYGVVLNFMQGSGPNMQPLAVSRVGMSREHAKSVLDVLRATLEQSDEVNSTGAPKELSAPEASVTDETTKTS